MELMLQALILFTVLQRLMELWWAKRNERRLLAQKALIIPEMNYFFMVLLHSSWLITLVVLVFTRPTELSSWSFLGGGILFLLGQILRLTAIFTLGERWSTRIVVLPQAPVVSGGIFKFIRHPNYVGVVLEILGLPLMGGWYGVALLFTCLNGLVLFFRIKKEESALEQYNHYHQSFPGKTV